MRRLSLLGGTIVPSLILLFSTLNAQPVTDFQGNVGIGTNAPDGSAVLELTASNRGFLMPRLTTAQRDALAGPATGLFIVNVTDTVPEYNCGTPVDPIWCRIVTDSNIINYAWRVIGNVGTNPADNFLGTLDAQPLAVRTDNTERMRILADGRVGIGTATPGADELLDVAGRVNTGASYDVDEERWLWSGPAGTANTFAGPTRNTVNTGDSNTFVGNDAGNANTTGFRNVFVGSTAGRLNTTGFLNTFVGSGSGRSTTDGSGNAFLGFESGQANTTGFFNVFVGTRSGFFNTTGITNTFVGNGAGLFNTTGSQNTFIGQASGSGNITGELNTTLGHWAGNENQTGIRNAMIGSEAGQYNQGSRNVFVGNQAGYQSTGGDNNTFVGQQAGRNNITGDNNTMLGQETRFAASGLTNAGAIGYRAEVAQNNSLVLGSVNGVNGATADVNVGIGTTSPDAKLEVENGDIYVDDVGGLSGVVLRSGSGACYRITVADPGVLVVTPIACP